MKKSTGIILLAALICVSANDSNFSTYVREVIPSEGNDDRIVGGYRIPIEQAAYQVLLRARRATGIYICGGSIISPTFILTAAHCLSEYCKCTSWYCRCSFWRNSTYNSTTLIIHPQYNNLTLDYDVGLIKLSENITINGNTTAVVPLVDQNETLSSGSNLFVTGWGVTSEGATRDSRYLMAVVVLLMSQDACRQVYTTATSRQICAGVNEGGKDACQGDSGGPAVLMATGTLVGITSYGYGCARRGLPGVYTNVADPGIRGFIQRSANV